MAAYLQLLIREGEDDFLLCSDGKRETLLLFAGC